MFGSDSFDIILSQEKNIYYEDIKKKNKINEKDIVFV